MKIGYACKLIGVPNADIRTCTLKNASREKLTALIKFNINSLSNMIDYNIDNNIKLFRISSDLIPFGSSEVNKLKWWEMFREELLFVGGKIKESNMRVSLHPGQYTVLNSNNMEVVQSAIDDLTYHARILDSLGVNQGHKVILHIGGAYDNKNLSVERFIHNFALLPDDVRKRIVIENDDKIYNIEEVLDIGLKHNIPVIFDILHHRIYQSQQKLSENSWIDQCRTTWKKEDGIQKIHYSQQAEGKKAGSHSESIRINEFMSFYKMLDRDDIDIMLEVKDKNLSCVKCINSTKPSLHITALEKEWRLYQYTILERSHKKYLEITELLKNNHGFSAVDFYALLEDGIQSEGDIGSYRYAFLHVWEFFKNSVSEKEKETFFKYLENFQLQLTGIIPVKNYLKKLAEKYEQEYLLNSYYFYMN